MTTFNYANTAATATRLIARFGAACVLTRTGEPVYDPSTGITTPATTDMSTTAVVIDMPQKYVDGTLIKQGDKTAYCVPSVVPVQGDVLTWQGAVFTIINVKPVSPAGVPVVFEAQIRGG